MYSTVHAVPFPNYSTVCLNSQLCTLFLSIFLRLKRTEHRELEKTVLVIDQIAERKEVAPISCPVLSYPFTFRQAENRSSCCVVHYIEVIYLTVIGHYAKA